MDQKRFFAQLLKRTRAAALKSGVPPPRLGAEESFSGDIFPSQSGRLVYNLYPIPFAAMRIEDIVRLCVKGDQNEFLISITDRYGNRLKQKKTNQYCWFETPMQWYRKGKTKAENTEAAQQFYDKLYAAPSLHRNVTKQ